MIGRIQMRCTVCNRAMEIERGSFDPPNTMEVLLPCTECDDGDFHAPRYLSASGRDVHAMPNSLTPAAALAERASDADVGADRHAVHYSSATDMWATPRALFDTLDAEFGFDLDVCAVASNAKCARYFSPDEDGLKQQWGGLAG